MATDFMKLKASLSLDSDQYEKGLSRSEKLAKGFGKAFKVSAVAIGAAASAVGVLVKKSIDAYGEYEQLAGGIKKLYGDASDDMMAYASKAYETAGMSANQYMQNVTGFSAALLNSLEGDSKEAAKIADMAMQDISDNANTFGKYTAEELAGVYQALAKGQYMTLDNLNLGFGGTKEGMQQLIDKANELAKAQGMAGDLTIDSYADIVQAIHLVQENLNITGTTEKEAAKTIQGSINMTKAAWQNLVAGFANPDSDIGVLVSNVMESASKAVGNLIPAISRAIDGMGTAINKMLPSIVSGIPKVINDILIPMVSQGITVITGVVRGLAQALPSVLSQLYDTLMSFMTSMTSAIATNLPTMLQNALTSLVGISETIRAKAGKFVDAGLNIVKSIAKGIIKSIPTIIQTVPTIISNFAGIINDNAPKILATGFQIIVDLVKGIVQAIPVIVQNLPQIVAAIWNVFTAINWLALGKQILTAIGNGIKAVGEKIPSILRSIGTKAWNAIKNINWASVGSSVVKLIGNGISALVSFVPNLLKSIASKAMQLFTGVAWGDVGKDVLTAIGRGITAAASTVITAVKDIITKIKNLFPFSIGKIFTGTLDLPIPKFNRSNDGTGGGTWSTTMRREPFAKAMSNPYLFKKDTLINQYAGHAWGGGEIMYGKNNLMRDMKEAVGSNGNIIINLNYDASADANDILTDIARGVKRYRMAGVV